MSELKKRIQDDMKEAMKAKENFKRDTLRMLSSAIKQIEIDEKTTLDDAGVLQVIKKALKQREDSASQYKEAGRDDLLEKEEKEIVIIREYMPKQLSDEELKTQLEAIISEVGAESPKDMGKVMGVATKKLGNVADGKRISTCVKALL